MAYTLSDNDRQLIARAIVLMQSGLAKEALAQQIQALQQEFCRVPISGLARAVMTDIECHLGNFASEILDCALVDGACSYDEGLVVLCRALQKLDSEHEPQQLYRRFIRWIHHEGAKN